MCKCDVILLMQTSIGHAHKMVEYCPVQEGHKPQVSFKRGPSAPNATLPVSATFGLFSKQVAADLDEPEVNYITNRKCIAFILSQIIIANCYY